MRKVIALIAASIVFLAAPPVIRHYGVAYELMDVCSERHALVSNSPAIDHDPTYLLIEFLSTPVALVLTWAAVGIHIYERKKSMRLR
jgi:hypothetical protein